jgi:hypothetical protein
MGGRGQQRAQIQLTAPSFCSSLPTLSSHRSPTSTHSLAAQAAQHPKRALRRPRPLRPPTEHPARASWLTLDTPYPSNSILEETHRKGGRSLGRDMSSISMASVAKGHDSHRTLLSGGPRFKESRDSIRLIQFLRDYLSSAGEHEHESTGASCFLCQTLSSCGRSHLAGQRPTSTRVVQR